MRVWRKKIFWVSILIIIMVVTLTLLLLYFHGKSNKEAEPEEWHMIDDGVYFNVYQRTRNDRYLRKYNIGYGILCIHPKLWSRKIR